MSNKRAKTAGDVASPAAIQGASSLLHKYVALAELNKAIVSLREVARITREELDMVHFSRTLCLDIVKIEGAEGAFWEMIERAGAKVDKPRNS